jgi:hypothetical protein
MEPHDEISDVIDDCRDLLAAVWDLHLRDNDILILVDLDRGENTQAAAAFFKAIGGYEIRHKWGRDRRMAAYLSPPTLIDSLERDGDLPHREAAGRLRLILESRKNGSPGVPLFVTIPGILRIVEWLPPEPDPGRN